MRGLILVKKRLETAFIYEMSRVNQPNIGVKIKILGCVIGRRRITMQPPLSGLVKTFILKPIDAEKTTFVHLLTRVLA